MRVKWWFVWACFYFLVTLLVLAWLDLGGALFVGVCSRFNKMGVCCCCGFSLLLWELAVCNNTRLVVLNV